MAFPTFIEIQSWSDEHLISVIEACKRLNWDISLGESQSEVDN